MAPGDLVPNPMNYRAHSPEQDRTLTALLHQVGWVDDVIVAEESNLILDGHLRVAIALREGEPVIPVSYVRLSPDEERLALATYDPLTCMSSLDALKVDALLRQIDIEQPDIQTALDSLSQFVGLSWGDRDDATISWAEEPGSPFVARETDTEDVPGSKSIRVLVGDYRTMVPLSVYHAWIDAIHYDVGFSEEAIRATILERLMTNVDS
ncbi:MAG: ParB N-terminal domain-containing protein [Deltaproteobacteria bacterium]|nr:ParB N-terminal domain-containing protein [Deltaproteobacteria bacterium]